MNKKKSAAGRECIILFTRFPQPGKVKTRMIDRLGPQGAARLHTKMTEQVIYKIKPALQTRNVQLQIYYCGGSQQEMADWLGRNRTLCIQRGSDLGQRMEHAFAQTIQQGAERILLIGSDCPDITADIIISGLKKLNSHDLVLGPAADGGYYLIGLRAPANKNTILFNSINWGTDQVLEQTLTQAGKGGLSYTLLPQLRDIDRPEDLVYFNHHTCS
ncbi:MAG: TIGR04282 family arsenosugar biosynthesis glycosyltransferase [Thermodesulfobacteriota bacterium]|nr:TIGR04282 family arsenosugar biosynthesis glycosyltransferase [Thermodesulfobacteriota bacterium]